MKTEKINIIRVERGYLSLGAGCDNSSIEKIIY